MFVAMGEDNATHLDQADRDFSRWMRREYRAKRLVAFVLEQSGLGIVAGGMVWLQERQPQPGFAGGGVPYLLSMYTEPRCRRQGLATRIIAAAQEWCRAHGHQHLLLHASRDGESLYQALGWKRTREYSLRLTPLEGPART
jgi:GNAT superfamily N-acetyltransferase